MTIFSISTPGQGGGNERRDRRRRDHGGVVMTTAVPDPKRRSVTAIRLVSGKLSGSRNETPSPYAGRSIDATVCHTCRKLFKPGQMRYPILNGTTAGWALVSICMECFKSDDWCKSCDPSRGPRQAMECPGCAEPIFVSPDLRPSLKLCSLRCYQRQYRKRRRSNGGSTIDWKWAGPAHRCECCKKPIQGKRQDSKFCSNKCRQWQYRQRGR
jgi:hypothetical protein